jgi:hypothetical protein
MKSATLELCSAPWPGGVGGTFWDFKIGKIILSKHFGLEEIGVLSVDRKNYGKQLLLKKPSEFKSRRVPLYVCPCFDLGCGALTVAVSETEEAFIWRDFGREGAGCWEDAPLFQTEYMVRA